MKHGLLLFLSAFVSSVTQAQVVGLVDSQTGQPVDPATQAELDAHEADPVPHLFSDVDFTEKTPDPGNPAEGRGKLWVTDGTNVGVAGDLWYRATISGQTRDAPVVQFDLTAPTEDRIYFFDLSEGRTGLLFPGSSLAIVGEDLDVVWSDAAALDGSGDVSPNAVTLGAQTTGDYVSGASANQGIEVTGGAEGGTVGLLPCAANQIMKRNPGATQWVCADDAGGPTVWWYNGVILTPSDTDSALLFRAPRETTIARIDCIVDPGDAGDSISLDIQRCNTSGLACATVDAAITCTNGGAFDDTLSNGVISAGEWVRMVLGTPVGTVDALTFSMDGSQ